MKNIEVEMRALITKEQYEELLVKFTKEGTLKKKDVQEIYYFAGEKDVRIQRNSTTAKMTLKIGELFGAIREEHEVYLPREEFDNLERFFLALGYEVEIKWFRERSEFDWKNITICIDSTKGYGYMLELEKMSTEENQEKAHEELLQAFKELGIKPSPKEILDEKFEEYKKNWRTILE